jgi:hypothetical protein
MPQIAERRLEDLVSVGPATLRDLKTLGIHSIEQLAQQDPRRMFSELCRANGPQDICCLDVFEAAVAQARDPNLSNEKCQWWYWSRKRKTSDGKE